MSDTRTIYYWNSRTDEYAPPTEPVEVDLKQALFIFSGLSHESFFGIEVSDEQFFQMLNIEATWQAELMDRDSLLGWGCTLSTPMAEQAIEAIFQGEDVKAWLSRNYNWLHWHVVQS